MEGEPFFNVSRIRWLIGIVLVVAVAIALYITFYSAPVCQTYECFQKNMASCSKASYINEEPEASWQYNVLGKEGTNCQTQVTMLQAKKGELGIDQLNGQAMICSYPIGIDTYPEKNLDACTGRLKESLQGVLIKKLYTYLLDNLSQFNKSLNAFS